MHIESIPMSVGKSNNYAYLVSDDKSKEAVIIDPAFPEDHWDHAGGNAETLKSYPLSILGGKDCAHVTTTPAHNAKFPLSSGSSIKITPLHTPCHTQDSICWFFEDSDANQRAVFTGDTLFTGGCGRFFEGTPKEMDTALNEVLAGLPDDTKVYPGHEYTKGNVKFGWSVLKNEAMTRLKEFSDSNGRTEGRFTIGDEKGYNVFMRLQVS
ncbi:MAG: hypothetical protein Q9162_005665 [Coniocarpon cinnabarinum]